MRRSPRELLELVQNYRQPTELHPIADRAFQLFEAAGGRLGEREVAVLRTVLEPLKAEERWVELMDALVSLYSFVIYANQKLDAPDAADAITELIREQRGVFLSIRECLDEAHMDGSSELRRRTRGWWGGLGGGRRAPRVGDPAPKGTIRASLLKPRAKPPGVPSLPSGKRGVGTRGDLGSD